MSNFDCDSAIRLRRVLYDGGVGHSDTNKFVDQPRLIQNYNKHMEGMDEQ